jgi:hypothetical protein
MRSLTQPLVFVKPLFSNPLMASFRFDLQLLFADLSDSGGLDAGNVRVHVADQFGANSAHAVR